LLPDASVTAKSDGLMWTGDLQAALDAAQSESSRGLGEKLVFIDFTGKTCSNCKLNEENVFTLNEIRELLRQYKLVQLYTDTVPDQLYTSAIRSQFKGSTDRQEADALANRKFQDRVFGTIQLPLYVILRPSASGQIEIVDHYTEGKINNVGAFTEFLKKPLNASTARVSND
jgi:thiol:disulfide interchange protein DsbD